MQEALQYSWKRFWCPRGGTISLADGGYLVDPDAEYGGAYHPDVMSFDKIERFRSLALLGEPGIGKSSALRSAANLKRNGQILNFDLRSYGSEDRLVRDLFEGPEIQLWKNATYTLHLFIDSLDEALLRIETLSALLADGIKKLPTDRLKLRIACRTADWPSSLEIELRKMFGEDLFGAYELAPLRRLDVAEAATKNGLDIDQFLSKIKVVEAIPLAIKPVTLDFLINLYASTGQFPTKPIELYSQGCLILCDEAQARQERLRQSGGSLTARQRLSIASRIAAVTIFGNRFAVWTANDRGDVPPEDVTMAQLSGGTELPQEADLTVTELRIRETLNTGLFSARGLNRMGWAHQTYSEFLAATYVLQRDASTKQIMSLLRHPDGHIVPQLAECAAWLASMSPTIFREVVRTDPDVLMASDVANASEEDRAELVRALLDQYEHGIKRDEVHLVSHYAKLKYPALSQQLRTYIADTRRGWLVRRAAIDIARACRLEDLQEELVQVALNSGEQFTVRLSAVAAITQAGDDAHRRRLRLLINCASTEDPDAELRGFVLRALWPNCISAQEMFDQLATPPSGMIGSYRMFVNHELAKHLRPQDLPLALRWIEGLPGHDDWCQKFVDSIMIQSVESLDVPGVAVAFADAACARFRRYEDLVGGTYAGRSKEVEEFRKEWLRADNKRRKLLEILLPKLSNPEHDWLLLVRHSTPFALTADIPWLIDRLRITPPGTEKLLICILIERLFDWNDSEMSKAVFSASLDIPELAARVAWIFNPIALGSQEAAKMKEEYFKLKQLRQEREKEPRLVEPPPRERIAAHLDRYEAGDRDAWWQLNLDMTLTENSVYYGVESQMDLTVVPGWKSAAPATRDRILGAARDYVTNGSPEPDKWVGKGIVYRPDWAGYRAILLLEKQKEQLDASTWARWAAVIVACPAYHGSEEKLQEQLIKNAYQHAPDKVIPALLTLIDEDNRDHKTIFGLQRMSQCWDAMLEEALLAKAKEPQVVPQAVGTLLEPLIRRKNIGARAYAEELVAVAKNQEAGEDFDRAVVASGILLWCADDAGWSTVWPAIQGNPAFGRAVVERYGRPWSTKRPLSQVVSEDQLGELYVWLVRQYPYENIRWGFGWMGPAELAAGLRDSILEELKTKGTPQAAAALHYVLATLPDIEWLKWVLSDAQAILRHKTWNPPTPREIVSIAADRKVRLVQSAVQLVDVLIESLGRLQRKLQGEVPMSQFLWNTGPERRPKEENELSDFIKVHFDEDLAGRGIIVNREVRIHRGERTDIHVSAVSLGSSAVGVETLPVISEVKGCWNRDLSTAMETQLIGQYLTDNKCKHGLYIVVWFGPEGWDDSDYRKAQAKTLNVQDIREQLEVQAKALSKKDFTIEPVVLDASLKR